MLNQVRALGEANENIRGWMRSQPVHVDQGKEADMPRRNSPSMAVIGQFDDDYARGARALMSQSKPGSWGRLGIHAGAPSPDWNAALSLSEVK